MTFFDPRDVSCVLGLACGALTPSQERLERSPEFKRAAKAELARIFDPFLQDCDFVHPFRGARAPAVALQPDAHGDVDPALLVDFTRRHLERHARGGAAVALGDAGVDLCWWDGKEWRTIGGFEISLDGAPWTADAVVDVFASDYPAARASTPAGFAADCTALRALRWVCWTSWGV